LVKDNKIGRAVQMSNRIEKCKR